jgi:hypothetical protein
MKRNGRVPPQLSASLDPQLNAYALAATAAGVGILALAQPLEAKIIYTPKHIQIGPGSNYDLSLNNDGITDVTIGNRASWNCLFATAAAGNLLSDWVLSNIEDWVLALQKGARIAGRDGIGGYALMASATTGGACRSSWCNVTNRYMGVRFEIKGKAHYGWARLNVSTGTRISATLTGYAYETVANKPIIAGKTKGPDVITVEPASLGHLARGASAVSACRRTRLAAP